MSVWAELLKKKLFLSSDVDTNHVIEVVRDSEEMISFQLDSFDLIDTDNVNKYLGLLQSKPDFLRL